MGELIKNRAHFFVRNKYTVFSMGGSVALRSINIFVLRAQICSYKYISEVKPDAIGKRQATHARVRPLGNLPVEYCALFKIEYAIHWQIAF